MIRIHQLRKKAGIYYRLAKPGIIYGNCLSAAAGFLLASRGSIDWLLFAALLAGMALVIASGCVLNNLIDSGIDSKMARTRQRALVTGEVNRNAAASYAITLAAAGFGLLVLFTNTLTVLAGLVGLVFYVAVYGAAKRRTAWATVIGSIPGAMPIVGGYLAVSGRLDTAAVLLFAAMALWQMPHFYAIAMYRLDDYRAAGVPVLPAQHGIRRTRLEILIYIAAFAAACALLSLTGYASPLFATAMITVSALWLRKGLASSKPHDNVAWAKRMFQFSLLVLLVFSLLLAVDWLLP